MTDCGWADRPQLVPIKKKLDRRENAREAKALTAARLEKSLERELIARLKSRAYGDQPLNVNEDVWKAVLNREKEVEQEAELELLGMESDDETEDEDEDGESEREFVSDMEDESDVEDLEDYEMNGAEVSFSRRHPRPRLRLLICKHNSIVRFGRLRLGRIGRIRYRGRIRRRR